MFCYLLNHISNIFRLFFYSMCTRYMYQSYIYHVNELNYLYGNLISNGERSLLCGHHLSFTINWKHTLLLFIFSLFLVRGTVQRVVTDCWSYVIEIATHLKKKVKQRKLFICILIELKKEKQSIIVICWCIFLIQ